MMFFEKCLCGDHDISKSTWPIHFIYFFIFFLVTIRSTWTIIFFIKNRLFFALWFPYEKKSFFFEIFRSSTRRCSKQLYIFCLFDYSWVVGIQTWSPSDSAEKTRIRTRAITFTIFNIFSYSTTLFFS